MDKISSLLLTYKNKALLMYQQDNSLDEGKNAWSLLRSSKNSKESFENAFERNVEKEMGIKIKKVEFVSESCYHAALSDDNVNRITRSEGRLISFFTLKELQKLFLSNSTREFVSKHGALISQSSLPTYSLQ